MKRENVVGRANVEDTPELEAYYRALEGEELGALWNVANEIEPWYPKPKSIPTLWAWSKVEGFVRQAAKLVSAEKAARRVVMLVNPGRKEWSAAAGLLYTGVQVMNPGEAASAHRHQASALRFVMEGRGAYTIVDGERLDLGARDFVLTPNGTWHEHGVDASGTQCVWQDGLDIPLMNSLDANFYEVHPKLNQTPAPLSRENWSKPYSPVFLYKWDESYQQLKKEKTFEYRNPLTEEFNFGYSWQLSNSSVIEAEYVHTLGLHENKTINIDQKVCGSDGLGGVSCVRPLDDAFTASGLPAVTLMSVSLFRSSTFCNGTCITHCISFVCRPVRRTVSSETALKITLSR